MSDIETLAREFIITRRLKLTARDAMRYSVFQCGSASNNGLSCLKDGTPDDFCEMCIEAWDWYQEYLRLSVKASSILRRLEKKINK